MLRLRSILAMSALCGVPLSAQQHAPPKSSPCATADPTCQNAQDVRWKELDAFHAVLMAVFHPMKGRNEVRQLRERAGELADRAAALSASAPPPSCARDTSVAVLPELKRAARELALLAWSDASDAQLATALRALHDKVEPLINACGGMRGMSAMKSG